MKKTYSKPDIAFESFSLSMNISAVGGCSTIVKGFANGNCGVNFGGRMVFMTNVEGCQKKVEDGSPAANYLCYHVPTEGKTVFNS
ncbi:MAG: hypothetical protein IJV82_03850 [Oscillospiraceae bacterium]|nr:hypothetical protein [Oscillospiraceae bacterium]